jgi:hypothetical protein
MEWNRNDWQGKSEKKVRFSHIMATISIAVLTIVMAYLLLATLVSCKSTEKVDCDAYSNISTKKVESTK